MAAAGSRLFSALDELLVTAFVQQRQGANGRNSSVELAATRVPDWRVVASTVPGAAGSAMGSAITGQRRWRSPALRVLHLNEPCGIAIVAQDRGKRAWILSDSMQMPARQFFHCVRLLRENGYGAERLHRDPGLQLVDSAIQGASEASVT